MKKQWKKVFYFSIILWWCRLYNNIQLYINIYIYIRIRNAYVSPHKQIFEVKLKSFIYTCIYVAIYSYAYIIYIYIITTTWKHRNFIIMNKEKNKEENIAIRK